MQQVPHLVLLDPGFYETTIKPLMIVVAKCWLEHQHFEGAILGGLSLEAVLDNKWVASSRLDVRAVHASVHVLIVT